jgi:hypothetical protein
MQEAIDDPAVRVAQLATRVTAYTQQQSQIREHARQHLEQQTGLAHQWVGDLPERQSPGPIIANRHSGIYHWPGCPDYGRIAPAHQDLFATRAAAAAAGYRAARNWQLQGTLQDRVELAGQAYARLQRPREPLTLVPWQAPMAPHLGREVTLTLTQRVPGRWEVTDITRVLGLVRALEPTRTRQRGWHPDLDTEEREHDQGRERGR